MHKIAAFIKFNKKIENTVLFYKNRVRLKFGKQTYLNHPVHSTLFTLDIKKISDLKKLYFNLKIKKKGKIRNILITSPDVFYNDPLTRGHTLYFSIKKSVFLSNLQLRHLKMINNNVTVLKKDSKILKNKKLKKNYLKYGFPFAGRIWKPHITIASISNIKKNDKFIFNFINKKIKFIDKVNKIEFYRIKNNKHYFLFKTDYI